MFIYFVERERERKIEPDCPLVGKKDKKKEWANILHHTKWVEMKRKRRRRKLERELLNRGRRQRKEIEERKERKEWMLLTSHWIRYRLQNRRTAELASHYCVGMYYNIVYYIAQCLPVVSFLSFFFFFLNPLFGGQPVNQLPRLYRWRRRKRKRERALLVRLSSKIFFSWLRIFFSQLGHFVTFFLYSSLSKQDRGRLASWKGEDRERESNNATLMVVFSQLAMKLTYR